MRDYKALERLGAAPELLAASINSASKEAMYVVAEQLNGDAYLLGFIGSWQDTLEDADVLTGLREWNAREALEAARDGRIPIIPPAKI
jgi:hypothetical protein